MAAPAETVLGVRGTDVDVVFFVVVGLDHAAGGELVVAFFIGLDGAHVDVSQSTALI